MKKISKCVCIAFISLVSLNVIAQNCDCTNLDSSQKKLYLNGSNFRLIDNALRCFKLNSIADDNDSLIRVWILEDDFPNKPTTWKVKMVEFGKNRDIPVANRYLLEWNFDKSDSSLPVKCIRKEKLIPNKGWLRFEKDIRRLNLLELYKKPYKNTGQVTVDYGMLIIQFLFEQTTYTVDFTGLLDTHNNENTLRHNYSKKIEYLLHYIDSHFPIKFSDNEFKLTK